MPSLRMRACNVVRFIPRRTAAPRGPPMRHCVCFKARRMCWRSASWRVKIEEVEAVKGLEEGKEFSPDAGSVADLRDRKSTRLNSSHDQISYAVFCLKKKKILLSNV